MFNNRVRLRIIHFITVTCTIKLNMNIFWRLLDFTFLTFTSYAQREHKHQSEYANQPFYIYFNFHTTTSRFFRQGFTAGIKPFRLHRFFKIKCYNLTFFRKPFSCKFFRILFRHVHGYIGRHFPFPKEYFRDV